jgi:probable HAF family extracellular repeat protein
MGTSARVLLMVAAAYGFTAPVTAQNTLIGVGSIGGSGLASSASAISADGNTVVGSAVVVGPNGQVGQAYRWTRSGGIVGLGDIGNQAGSQAIGVSADGSVIVGMASSVSTPFRWTLATGITQITGMPSPTSNVRGVSGDGVSIVGVVSTATAVNAVRWTQATGPVSLGFMAGGGPFAIATGTNMDGSVVVGFGEAGQVGGGAGRSAFRWTSDAGMTPLGGFAGQPLWSEAAAVSGDGTVVVGQAQGANGMRPFRWSASTGMIDLNVPGDGSGMANAVSADGSVVVGSAAGGAFIWTPQLGSVNLLSYLIQTGASEAIGWQLMSAYGVSADGTVIVGQGRTPSGRFEGFVAVIPAPGVTAVVCLGLAAAARRRRSHAPAT